MISCKTAVLLVFLLFRSAPQSHSLFMKMKQDILLANDVRSRDSTPAEIAFIDVPASCVLSCWTAWSQSYLESKEAEVCFPRSVWAEIPWSVWAETLKGLKEGTRRKSDSDWQAETPKSSVFKWESLTLPSLLSARSAVASSHFLKLNLCLGGQREQHNRDARVCEFFSSSPKGNLGVRCWEVKRKFKRFS